MTFEDLVKAEAKRREIEKLTADIQLFLDAHSIVVRAQRSETPVPAECLEPMRQAGIEAVAARVVVLLEESRSLGIDVTSAKNALEQVLTPAGVYEQPPLQGPAALDAEIEALVGGAS